MALILAIEPDRRQAAQLTRLIQTRVGAELVLAETTEQALGAIGNRVPDLVLVPALLAPQDDATLATALRVIAATAHVQMLTIPVLARASGARQRLGVLARWRGKRAESPAPDGCDPDVFGDQIAAYLAEAAAERAINQSDMEMDLSTLITKNTKHPKDIRELSQHGPALSVHVVLRGEHSLEEPADDEPPIAAERFMVAEPAAARAILEPDLEMTLSTVQEARDTELQSAPVEELIADKAAIAAAEALTLAEADIEEVQLAATLDLAATSGKEPAARLDVSKPLHVSEAPWFGPQRRWPDMEGEEAVDALTASTAEDTAGAAAQPEYVLTAVPPSIDLPTILAASNESPAVVVEEMPLDVQDALPAIEMMPIEEPAPEAVPELWMPLSSGSARSWPTIEGVWSEPRPDPPVVVRVDPPAVAAAPPASSPAPARVPSPPDTPAARPEWIELIESLRQDVKRLRSERTEPPVVGARGKTPSLRRAAVADGESPKKRANTAKPAQDEWGFFDPEQCGFAALLAKLDEITHVNDVV